MSTMKVKSVTSTHNDLLKIEVEIVDGGRAPSARIYVNGEVVLAIDSEEIEGGPSKAHEKYDAFLKMYFMNSVRERAVLNSQFKRGNGTTGYDK